MLTERQLEQLKREGTARRLKQAEDLRFAHRARLAWEVVAMTAGACCAVAALLIIAQLLRVAP